MAVDFAPLNDGSHKSRLEAQVTGTGKAWIATNGKTIRGTWKKSGFRAKTRFFDRKRQPGDADARPDLRPGRSQEHEDHRQGRQGAAATAGVLVTPGGLYGALGRPIS